MPSRNEANPLCSLSTAAEGLLYALEGWQYNNKNATYNHRPKKLNFPDELLSQMCQRFPCAYPQQPVPPFY